MGDKSAGTSAENALSSVSDNRPPSNNVDLSICYTRTDQYTAQINQIIITWCFWNKKGYEFPFLFICKEKGFLLVETLILDCTLKQVTRPVNNNSSSFRTWHCFHSHLLNWYNTYNYIPLRSFEWSIRYKYKTVKLVVLNLWWGTEFWESCCTVTMLLLHKSEYTDACSFLQGSKSISETLCGMYNLWLYLCRTLAVCEIVWKLQCSSQNSFLCYIDPCFTHLSIKSSIFCFLIVVLDIGCVFIENLNLRYVSVADKHNFALSTKTLAIDGLKWKAFSDRARCLSLNFELVANNKSCEIQKSKWEVCYRLLVW